jgi:hypothetical protein
MDRDLGRLLDVSHRLPPYDLSPRADRAEEGAVQTEVGRISFELPMSGVVRIRTIGALIGEASRSHRDVSCTWGCVEEECGEATAAVRWGRQGDP